MRAVNRQAVILALTILCGLAGLLMIANSHLLLV